MHLRVETMMPKTILATMVPQDHQTPHGHSIVMAPTSLLH